MIPTALVELPAIPLTVNGKLDRKALPPPGDARPELGRKYAPARSIEEELLAGIWAEVLGLERVGIDDNFFELGGDSILSIQVVARAQRAGVDLSVRSMFKHQTIRELAEAVAAGGQLDEESSPLEPFALIAEEDRKRLPADIEDAYPLAKLQLGMVYHNELAPEASVYHDVLSLHVEAEPDPENLRFALDRLVAAHPMLRTSFDFTSYSGPLQLVHRTAAIPLVVEDFSSLSTVEHEAALSARIETDRRRSFDLASAPLLRVYLHRRGDHAGSPPSITPLDG